MGRNDVGRGGFFFRFFGLFKLYVWGVVFWEFLSDELTCLRWDSPSRDKSLLITWQKLSFLHRPTSLHFISQYGSYSSRVYFQTRANHSQIQPRYILQSHSAVGFLHWSLLFYNQVHNSSNRASRKKTSCPRQEFVVFIRGIRQWSVEPLPFEQKQKRPKTK